MVATKTLPFCLLAFALLLLLAAAPSSLSARSQAEFGRYLGLRLQMYEEAYRVLDREIRDGDEERKIQARATKAEIIKAEADHRFASDGNVEARNRSYERALEVFGDPKSDASGSAPQVTTARAILAKGRLMNELAQEVRRTNPVKAREYLAKAAAMLDAERKRIENLRAPRDDTAFREVYAEYSGIYFQLCTSHYIRGLTHEFASEQRISAMREARSWLDEFQFALDDMTEEQILSYELQGDIEIALGNAEGAVRQFLVLASLLGPTSGQPANVLTGRLAIQHGYLRAAELLTGELDYEPQHLQQTLDLYGEAFARYGRIPELDHLFKRFQLYRVSALIKMGDATQVRGALDLLFRLSEDRDPFFRRQVISVVADIATRPGLDSDTRFRCAELVYSDLEFNSTLVILKNIQAYQMLLAASSDRRTFETYAPACYHRIGHMYYRMWRFLDSALVYREGAYRTGYFFNSYAEITEVPEHMRGRCELITDAESVAKFPGELAQNFERLARFLLMGGDVGGDPGNRNLEELHREAVSLRAELGGEQAVLDLQYRQAGERMRAQNHAQAAVRYLSLPANYRLYHMALYFAARSYYSMTEDPTSQRINQRGEPAERESEEFFRTQRERHATDLAALPRSMWEGMEKWHWDAIMNRDTHGGAATWHKAVYYYKKYLLIEVRRSLPELQESLADVENPTLVDGLRALTRHRNQAWTRANPEGEGPADADMRRMGFAAHDLAYLLRNPPRFLPPAVREELREESRSLALAILRPYWTMFGPHLADSIAYRRSVLIMAFGALVEDRDAAGCEEVYRAFSSAFPEENNHIASMARRLYNLLLETMLPQTQAMLDASNRLTTRANRLKQNRYAAIAPDFAEDHQRLVEAKTRFARHQVLADHFWNITIKRDIFEGEANANLVMYLPDLLPTIEERWNEMAATYPERWGKAVVAEIESLLQGDQYGPIRGEVKAAMENLDAREAIDRLVELRNRADNDAKRQLLAQLVTAVELNTEALQWFVGTIWIYEFAGFLESLVSDINARARPVTTRILRAYEESRTRSGQDGIRGLEDRELFGLGAQYFRIRDWQNTVRYWTEFKGRSEAAWGDVTQIPVNQRDRVAGRPRSSEELEVRYQLGKAHLELYKETGEQDHLIQAALNMRRCWAFNLLRDTKEISSAPHNLLFQPAMERYYLAIGNAMAEIFVLLHEAEGIKVDWPAYVDQFSNNLAPRLNDEKEPLRLWAPTSESDFLWAAADIHLRIYGSFRQLSAYRYRTEFQTHLELWLATMIRWVKRYGTQDMGIEELKGDRARTRIQETYDRAVSESSYSGAFLDDATAAFLERIRTRGQELLEAAKEAGIQLRE